MDYNIWYLVKIALQNIVLVCLYGINVPVFNKKGVSNVCDCLDFLEKSFNRIVRAKDWGKFFDYARAL